AIAVAANRVSAVIELNPSATDRTNRAMPYSVRAMTTLMPSRNPVPVITGKIISRGSDGMANNSPDPVMIGPDSRGIRWASQPKGMEHTRAATIAGTLRAICQPRARTMSSKLFVTQFMAAPGNRQDDRGYPPPGCDHLRCFEFAGSRQCR